MSLLDILEIPEDVVNDPNYYVHLETHVEYLKYHKGTMVLSVTGLEAEKYKADFYGLLLSLKVERKYHYLVMRMNGYANSSDYDGIRTDILYPDVGEAARVIDIYSSLEL